MLSSNTSHLAYKLVKKYLNKINWCWLSRNPSKWAYKLLNKIDWDCLSENTSRWAYKLLKNKPDKIDWDYFSSSPYLFKIVKTNYKLLNKKLI